MNTLAAKVVKTALLSAVPLTFAIVGYLLYNQPLPGTPTGDFVRDDDTSLSPKASIKAAEIQASITKELDSIERYPSQKWNTAISRSAQDSSLSARQGDGSAQNRKRRTGVLEGPSAFFSHRYSLRVGKPVPVSILWAPDSSFSPVKLELVTITLTDVSDDKAGFTMSESSSVLLHSGAQYAVSDNISIEDKDHNLHISVLQVSPDSVSIELTSNLTDEMVSQLKGWD